MRQAKSKYFWDKIQNCSHTDVKRSCSLINTLLDPKRKFSNVKQLIIDDTIISDDKLIAESINEYFINVGININREVRFGSSSRISILSFQTCKHNWLIFNQLHKFVFSVFKFQANFQIDIWPTFCKINTNN